MNAEEHERRVGMVRTILAECVEGFTPDMVGVSHVRKIHTVRYDPAIPEPQIRKAIRLVRMSIDGPSVAVLCDAHSRSSCPNLWNACQKVPVSSALRGQTCGAA